MGRSESKAVEKQATSQSKGDQQLAEGFGGNLYTSIGKYRQRLNDYMDFGNRIYGEGGEFAQTANTESTDVAEGGARGLESDLALNSLRSGENTAGYATTAAESRRQGARELTKTLADKNLQRLAALSHIQETGLQAEQFPAEMEQRESAAAMGSAASSLGPAASAAAQPGFWDVFAPALAGAAGGVATGFTPHG